MRRMRVSKHLPRRSRIALLFGVLAVAASAVTVATVRAVGEEAPPPGYSQEEWDNLPAAKQAQVRDETWTALNGVSRQTMAAAGAQRVATNPDPGPDPEGETIGEEEEALNVPFSGILDTPQSPFGPEQYIFENQWQDTRDDELVHAYAGARYDDPSRGVLVIRAQPWPHDGEDDDFGTVDEYLAPAGVGSLRLTSVDGDELSFVSADDETGTFDLVTREYHMD